VNVVLLPGTKSLGALALLLHIAGGSAGSPGFSPYYDMKAWIVSVSALSFIVLCFFEEMDYCERQIS
jgi:hypothetical protein